MPAPRLGTLWHDSFRSESWRETPSLSPGDLLVEVSGLEPPTSTLRT